MQIISPPSKIKINFRVGDFNADGLKEIFIQWHNGCKFEAEIFQIKGKTLKILYQGPADRANVEIKDIDKDGICEILERGDAWHIVTEEKEERLRGCLYAMRILKWNRLKGKWIFWKTVPDIEVMKKLTLKEVWESIGAREILKGVPLKRLKELYPRAFK